MATQVQGSALAGAIVLCLVVAASELPLGQTHGIVWISSLLYVLQTDFGPPFSELPNNLEYIYLLQPAGVASVVYNLEGE